jgi:hypothetical protein
MTEQAISPPVTTQAISPLRRRIIEDMAIRALMNKPTTAVAMSFDEDPYPGISAAHFSGEAVAFPTTLAFERRTASLR